MGWGGGLWASSVGREHGKISVEEGEDMGVIRLWGSAGAKGVD